MANLTKAEQSAASEARSSLRRKLAGDALVNGAVRKGMVALTSGVYGALHRYGVRDDIAGFPWRLGVWTLATITEALSRGAVQSTAAGISDASMAVYLERAIATDSLVAGDNNDDGVAGDNNDDGGEY